MESDEKFLRVCQFYAVTHKLKTLLRSGWIQWQIDTDRFESVAEHIYGTQMLAFAICSEFNVGVDVQKVILMLAFHELGECAVGDITPADGISKAQKHKLEADAVENILKPLSCGGKILELFDEFEEEKTKESQFAHFIDKFECDLQCKYYEEMGCNDFLTPRKGWDEKVRCERMKAGDKTLAQAWINYDKKACNYDKLFSTFADFVISNDCFKHTSR